MKKSLKLAVAIAGVAFNLAVVPSAVAQTATASINATAQVQVALSSANLQALDFGAVFPGTNNLIAPTNAASGAVSFSGAANAEVQVTFTLPGTLDDIVSGQSIPIVFSATSGASNTTNSRAGASVFDPNAPLVTRLDVTTGELYVFLGGEVSATTQPAGTYSNTIQVQAAYTGN